jgi:holliday junction DNA helicase RuvB
MGNTVRHILSLIRHKTFCNVNSACRFEEIIGHNVIKRIFVKAILSDKPIHLLLLGSPACAKTMFLTEIMRNFKSCLFVVGSNATKAGLLNQLFERRPKFLLIDELEKMNSTDQTSLLHLMETGTISESKINKTRQIELTSWVFATANSSKKIIEPLISRFLVLEVSEYSFEEFRKIALFRLEKEKVDENIALVIAEKVWNELGSKDIRDVVKIGRLANSILEVSFMVNVMKRRQDKISVGFVE